MKFLVFGGTGFIGENLVNYLKFKGEEVKSVSRSGRNNSFAIDINVAKDFSKIEFVPDVIINCASQVPVRNKTSKDPEFLAKLFNTNVIGALNISNWAVRMKVPKILNISTLVVNKKPWPNPLTENHFSLPEGSHVGYSMSKLSQELIMNNCIDHYHETNLMHIRLSAVYGIGMNPEGIIFSLLNDLKNNNEITLNEAKINTIDFINVLDICKAIYVVSKKPFEFKIMNLASGKPISVFDLALILKKIMVSDSIINNIETNANPSFSNININRLLGTINNTYDNFISIEKGLNSLVKDLNIK